VIDGEYEGSRQASPLSLSLCRFLSVLVSNRVTKGHSHLQQQKHAAKQSQRPTRIPVRPEGFSREYAEGQPDGGGTRRDSQETMPSRSPTMQSSRTASVSPIQEKTAAKHEHMHLTKYSVSISLLLRTLTSANPPHNATDVSKWPDSSCQHTHYSRTGTHIRKTVARDSAQLPKRHTTP
jgi:hypothetical protein